MKPTDLVLVLIANLAWAFNFIAGKVGVEHFPPFLFTTLRFSLVLLLLLPFLRPIPGKVWPMLQIGLVLGVGHFSLMFAGLNAAGDVSSIAIIAQLYVPFSTILAVILLNETIGWRRISAITIAFVGVMIIGFDPIVLNHLSALIYILGAALLMAVASILMRNLQGVGVFQMQAWLGLIATPGLLCLSLIFESEHINALQTADWVDFSAVAYSAIGASIIGHGLYFYLLQRYPVSTIAPLLLLTPIFAIIFGVVLLNDQLTWRIVLGGTATLLGILVITQRSSKKAAGTAN